MANNTTNGDSNRRVFDLMNLLTQEEDPFFEPTSTAVAKKPVRKREEPIAEDYGSISEDPRSFIQRKADEIYESGPAGAALAAIADILPGIPFVDIIDPPEQLSDPSSQTARNLLGAVGLVAGMAKTPQAVGRVATNIREPWGYGEGLERILGGINIDGEDVYLNIPTILGGSIVGTDSSLSIILENEGRDPETGEKLIFYGAEDEAVEGAKDRMRIQNSEKMISKMDSYLKGRF